MSELWQLGALELAAAIKAGDTSSRAVVEAHLARIDAVNPHLNAIVRRFDEQALAEADAADKALAEAADPSDLPVFHGVPCTVKENIDLAGTPTTQGIPALAEAIAPIDAPSIERLRAAGAIPIGRTNLPDLGLRIHTRSTLHGLTRNPWNPNVTAGGSSGGEASALAAGMSPLGLGNDIGGSLRNPAHCCGIASVKPTTGVVPMATVIPPEDSMLAGQVMLAEGPMARHVADVRAAIAGWSPRDPRSVPAVLTDLAPGEQLKVAVMADPPGGATHPEIAAAVRRAADVLADAGHDVVEATPPDYELAIELWAMLLLGDLAVQKPLLDLVLSPEASAILDSLQARYPVPTLESAITLNAQRFAIARGWSAFFTEHPVLLSPTWAMPPFEHDADTRGEGIAELLADTLRPVLPGNLLGIPAAIVPVGQAAGTPVGVQVYGDRFTDLRCLAVAEQIESAVGTPTPIDPVL
ncbi:MAG TPA: amidase [Ilumatobacter sp.]|nr:amidase [Ilumatobacter sp.]